MQKKRNALATLLLMSIALSAYAQSYSHSANKTIPGTGQEIFDTITVNSLNPAIVNNVHGLASVQLNLTYSYDQDLVISLIAPDGTKIRLSENEGSGGADFTGTVFTMSVNNFINDASAPFTGTMQPEGWLGMCNNGQNGNGHWILDILNTTTSNNTGILTNWSLTFSNNPAPPTFFDSSKLPIVVINTHNDVAIPFYSDTRVNGNMGIIDNGGGQTNHITDAYNGYNGNITIKVRGNSTRYFPQKAYALSTVDVNGDDSDATILGMPAESDWILYAPWDDKSLIRNVITYKLSNDMGEYASRTRMCEVVLNGDYRGVYVMEEKIKRGHDRVDISKLKASDTTGANLTGGYIFQVDRGGVLGYDNWNSTFPPCDSSASAISFAYSYPKAENINNPQKQYIANYVDSFEQALKYGDLYDTVHGYRKFIDVPSFIDFSLLQEIGHNVDGYRLSSYCYKNKSQKMHGGPIWDFNEAYGNADYYDGADTTTFQYNMPCPFPDDNLNPFWWKRFLNDTNYVAEYKCRYTQLRTSVWDSAHINGMLDSLTALLQMPQTRHFERWPILGVYTWPNAYVGVSWADEMDYLRTWLHNRMDWMDNQLINPACITDTTVDTSSGIAMLTYANDVRIYPNPAHDVLQISAHDNIKQITVYNMLGQQVYAQETNNTNYSIPLLQYGIANGVYTISITTDKGLVRRTFVVTGN